ncbi:MAG: hypothetical protein ACHRHE_23760 [Tepidisphaerales bacterium]
MIFAPDVFLTGEFGAAKPMPISGTYAGYTFGYNRPLVAQRVHDILTAVTTVKYARLFHTVHLVGWEKAGPWVVLARGLCGDAVARTAADINGFRFEKVAAIADEMMLPGAAKYGGLPALAALVAPGELSIHNNRGTGMGQWLKAAYAAAGAADHLHTSGDKLEAEKVAEWLVR